MARVLGIDIGPSALRGTLLKTTFRKTEVERHVQVPLTEAPGSPGRAPELADAYANMVRALGTPPDVVVAPFDGEQLSLRVVELPRAAIKRVADVLPFELETTLPFEPEDAVIDYQQIGSHNGQVQFLAAAALRRQVEERLTELRSAGIEPRELAAGGTALESIATFHEDLQRDQVVMVVDLADDRTDLCVMRGGRCETARTLSMGIQSLPAEGEKLWRGVQRTIASYRAGGGGAIERVLLSGTGALAEGAARWLSEQVGKPVDILDAPPAPGIAAGSLPLFVKSAALAAHGARTGKHINLRSGALALTDTSGQLRQHTNLLGACGVVILTLAMFSIRAEQSLLIDEQEVLRAKLASETKDIFGKPTIDPSEIDKLMRNAGGGDPLPRFDAFDALSALSHAVAPTITHDVRRLRLEVADEKREGRLELQGTLGSLEQRDLVVAELEKHDCIRDIETGKTTPAQTPNRINYQIEAVVRCTGDAQPGKKRRGSTP